MKNGPVFSSHSVFHEFAQKTPVDGFAQIICSSTLAGVTNSCNKFVCNRFMGLDSVWRLNCVIFH